MRKVIAFLLVSVFASVLNIIGLLPISSANAATLKPVVTRVVPNVGPVAGGVQATIYGANFSELAKVTFGSRSATVNRTSSNSTTLVVKVPSAYRGRTGFVTVKVSNSSRVYGTLQNGYRYVSSLSPLLADAGADVYDYTNKPISMSGTATGGVLPYSFSWKFADNTTSDGTTATHTYSVSGNYTVLLTVTDSSGATASDTAVDFIFPEPTPTPTPTSTATPTATPSQTPTPTATPSPSPTASPSATPSATLIPTKTPSPTPSATPSPTPAGSATPTATPNPTPTKTPTPTPTATPFPLPVANAGVDKIVNEGSSVSFTGSASGGATPFTYAWDFGDGTTASGSLTPTKTYADNGIYTVRLTVTDAQGRSSQDTAVVTVNNVAPTVGTDGPYSATPGATIYFIGSATDPSSTDTNAGFTYTWTFGDGATANTRSTSHVYATAGSYTVTFTARDKDRGIGSLTTSALVSSQTVQPITSPTIDTPYLSIPNFGAHPNIYSVKSGNWSDPSVWSLSRIPATGDIVNVYPGTTVIYDLNDATNSKVLDTVEVQPTGTLTFRTDINTQICVGNLMVLQNGSLIVGTAANPIATNVSANIVIANRSLSAASDTLQFGTGLIIMGNVTMHGSTKTAYMRLQQDPHAGDTVLHLASPVVGWKAGDTVLLPDTRQLNADTSNTSVGEAGSAYSPQFEEVTVQSVSADGRSVTASTPLRFGHLGAYDLNGVERYLAHAANFSRNISITSQSYTGTRGYTLFTGYGSVDVEYVSFSKLGRTNSKDLVHENCGSGAFAYNIPSSCAYDSTMPINYRDRYTVTILDLIGPAVPPGSCSVTLPSGNCPQFSFIGNEVDNESQSLPNRTNIMWGIALKNSSYGLIQNNDVWGIDGVGIGIEDGASSFNVIDGNFVGKISGDSNRTNQFFQGDAYWFASPKNKITNNIATDINSWNTEYSYGYDIDLTAGGQATIPARQGADPRVSGIPMILNATPLLDFSGNEIYGATSMGMTSWNIGLDTLTSAAGPPSVIKNLVVWHNFHWGYFGYPSGNLTIDGMVVLGDANTVAATPYTGTTGITLGDYQQIGLVIKNADISATMTGIFSPTNVGMITPSATIIESSSLNSWHNITHMPPETVDFPENLLAPLTLVIKDVQFGHPPMPSNWWAGDNLSIDYNGSGGSFGTPNYSVPDLIYLCNYSGTNYQVYYTQTAPAGAVSLPGLMGGLAIAFSGSCPY